MWLCKAFSAIVAFWVTLLGPIDSIELESTNNLGYIAFTASQKSN